MNIKDAEALARLKTLLEEKVPLHRLILFGSRARGEADEESDMDVLVVLAAPVTAEVRRTVRDCAWEVGFDAGFVVSTVMVSRRDWEEGPDRFSLLAAAIAREGVPA